MNNQNKQNVASLGRIMGIWAHPDDEVWASAGFMYYASENGQEIAIITATRGEAGDTADEAKWPKAELARIRTQEHQNSLSLLGVKDITWLDYPDGQLDKADREEVVARLLDEVNTFKPDTILTFECEGMTGHSDHKTIHDWAVEAARKANKTPSMYCAIYSNSYKTAERKLNQLFNTQMDDADVSRIDNHNADMHLELDAAALEAKLKSMYEHKSQLTHMFEHSEAAKALKEIAACECFIAHDI